MKKLILIAVAFLAITATANKTNHIVYFEENGKFYHRTMKCLKCHAGEKGTAYQGYESNVSQYLSKCPICGVDYNFEKKDSI